jgi:hypothetical protein
MVDAGSEIAGGSLLTAVAIALGGAFAAGAHAAQASQSSAGENDV